MKDGWSLYGSGLKRYRTLQATVVSELTDHGRIQPTIRNTTECLKQQIFLNQRMAKEGRIARELQGGRMLHAENLRKTNEVVYMDIIWMTYLFVLPSI